MHWKEWVKRAADPEVHEGAPFGHIRVDKTCFMMKEHYNWPKMTMAANHFGKRCSTYHPAKSHVLPKVLLFTGFSSSPLGTCLLGLDHKAA